MIIKKIYDQVVLHRWDLAFIDQSLEDILKGKPLTVTRVKSPWKDRWFADPYILSVNEDKIVLLVEDYRDADQIGKISKVTIDRKTMTATDSKIILQLPTHLSFPAIYERGEKLLIYPENNNHGKDGLYLYEYDPKTDEIHRLMQWSHEPLADAYATNLFGRRLLFSTWEPIANKNTLGVFEWDEAQQEYVHQKDILFEENIARNAGAWFSMDGKVYRPAQECNQMYGHAVVLQQVEEKGDTFEFHEVRRILPFGHAFGIHTFNSYDGLTVVDLKVFRHPWIARPLFKLRNLFK